jgi:hypothetical protein
MHSAIQTPNHCSLNAIGTGWVRLQRAIAIVLTCRINQALRQTNLPFAARRSDHLVSCLRRKYIAPEAF